MTHFQLLRDPKWLGHWDFEDAASQTKPLTIAKVGTDEVFNQKDQANETVPALFFEGMEKGMICNVTNLKTLAALYGDQYEAWVGKPILIEVKEVKAFGDLHKALRIKPQRVQSQAKPTAPATTKLPPPEPDKPTVAQRKQVWSLLSDVHGDPAKDDAEGMQFGMDECNNYLWREGLLNPDGTPDPERLNNISAKRMQDVIDNLVEQQAVPL